MAYKVLDHRGRVAASSEMDTAKRRKKALSAYRGAGTGRTQADWTLDPSSADATLIPEKWALAYRIRERMRNDPVMRGALHKVVDAVVGPNGFSTSSQLDHERIGLSEDQAREIESDIDTVWEEWQETCDYAGNPARQANFVELLSLRYNTEVTTGEDLTFARFKQRPWSRFSFCVEVLAPDRIVNPSGAGGVFGVQTGPNGEDIRDGVHVGSDGGIRGIYLAKEHPYSYLGRLMPRETTYIPSINRKTGRVNFWLSSQRYRTEATRGEPLFAACLLGFKALGDYLGDEVTRAHMTTLFGLAIEREEPFDPDVEGLLDADKVGDEPERDEAQIALRSGMVHYLKPGEKASVINPNVPGPQFGEFTDKVATWSASPLGLAREDVLNDFSGMNFSSSKASRVATQRGKKKIQNYVVSRFVLPPREIVIEEAWRRGYLQLPGFEDPAIRRLYFANVTYAAPWTDLEPVKEETASKLRLANRTSSLTRECALKGVNFRTLTREWAREKQELERAGLPLPPHLMEAPTPGDLPVKGSKPTAETASGKRSTE